MPLVAQQHHDVARVRRARHRQHEPRARLAQVRDRRAAHDAPAGRAREGDHRSAGQSVARDQQRAARGDLMGVGAAPGLRHAADARDAHAQHVRARRRRLLTGPAPCSRARASADAALGGAAGARRGEARGGWTALQAGRAAPQPACRERESRSRDRLWAASIAKTILLRGRARCPIRRRPRLAAMPWRTEQRDGSCVGAARAARQPQRKPVAEGAGASGLEGRSGRRVGQVEAGRRHVVGRVGVEQRGEVLDLARARRRARTGRRRSCRCRARRSSRRRRAACAGRRSATA